MTITRSSSAARSAWRAVAARGWARTTSRLPSRQRRQIPADQMTQPTADRVADHRRADCPADRETHPGRLVLSGRTSRRPLSSRRPAVRPCCLTSSKSARLPHPRGRGKHRRSPPGANRPKAGQARWSDADPLAPLAAPGGEHRAAGPGAHAQPEAMRLRTAAVVRLKRTLAHWGSRSAGAGCCQAHTSRPGGSFEPRGLQHSRQLRSSKDWPYLRQANERSCAGVTGLPQATRRSGGGSNQAR